MRAPGFLTRAWTWLNDTRRRQVVGGLVLAGLIVAVVLVVRGGVDLGDDGPGDDATTTTTAAATTAPPSTLPEPPPDGDLRFLPEGPTLAGPAAPLTGLPVPDGAVLARPALAVKIDNLDTAGESARPQTGLAFADIVVEEVVEGGITRFVALLHSTDSPEVGPVRSARTTDAHLLPAFGQPLFAFSGGNPGVLAAVADAPGLVDRGGEWAPAYVRVPERRAPHNLFLRPWEVWARGGGSPPPPFSWFRPQGTPSPVGEVVQGVELGFRGAAAAPVTWTWLPEHARWLRYQRGTVHVDGEGYAVGPRNVVVMVTEYRASPADPRSPEAVTVGSGEAIVLTDGRAVRGTWARPSVDSPLAFLDGDGRSVSLTAGRTWIELVHPGTAALVP